MLIYKATNIVNNKSYIGKTSERLCKRKSKHFQNARKGNAAHFASAIRKYGKGNFSWEILEDNISNYELLAEREKYWIEFYNTYKTGYNSTVGGDGTWGYNHSEEAKKKMSECRKNYTGWKHTEETKDKLRIASKKRCPNGVIEWTEEQRKKRSESISGENNPMYGRSRKGEFAGEKNGMYGKKHTPETKAKLRQAWEKRREQQNNTRIAA